MNRIIRAEGLAEPVGFSHAVLAGNTVYLGGQTAQAPGGEIVGETLLQQFDLAASNLVTALKAAGGEPDDLGPIWRRHFGRRYPAMALFGIAELFDPAARVELMGTAVLST